jgi:hypothetical protein
VDLWPPGSSKPLRRPHLPNCWLSLRTLLNPTSLRPAWTAVPSFLQCASAAHSSNPPPPRTALPHHRSPSWRARGHRTSFWARSPPRAARANHLRGPLHDRPRVQMARSSRSRRPRATHPMASRTTTFSTSRAPTGNCWPCSPPLHRLSVSSGLLSPVVSSSTRSSTSARHAHTHTGIS